MLLGAVVLGTVGALVGLSMGMGFLPAGIVIGMCLGAGVGQTVKHRDEHKKVLLSRWDEAVKKNQIDEGIEILQLLDNYLSPKEAAALEESARGVFRAKLSSLGVQFKMLVTEKKWGEALRIGKEIIDEFPNSRMAQEVRDKLGVLEGRAKTLQEN